MQVSGHELAYRGRGSRGPYFRLVSTCGSCGSPWLRRTVKIRSRDDLATALRFAEWTPGWCDACDHAVEPANAQPANAQPIDLRDHELRDHALA